ncbi:hypothetical protein KR222_003441 [Zaprionus bogoriensis]|nr:hypothetical protein KR222_003441 [Zaprionus bogoriensis]
MAIAYFIPDQAQLLARSSQQAAGTSASPRPNPNSQQQPPQPQEQQQEPAQGQRGSEQQRAGSSQFRGNISFPLGRQQGAMSMSEFGCWELLAQIFCYALRVYNYNSAQRRPTVIQISFEINCGTSEPETEQDGGDRDEAADHDDEDATDATLKLN